MFKLVVLSLFAVAAAEPGVFFTAPYTTYSSVVAPASTTITKTASSVVHPSPVVYSAPLYSHFIKKRSPGVLAYNYAPTTYVSSLPYAATPLLSTPLVHSTVVPAAPIAYTATHLIKKRSAPLLIAPTTYAAASPLISTYAASSVISTPLLHSSPLISTPLTYSTHFIKKRSAPLFVAPTTYTAASPLIASTYAATPLVHSSPLISTPLVHSSSLISTPLTYSTHFIKKRSAPLFVAPTTYTAASPLIASTYAAAPVISTPLVHSTPLISTPLTYATHFIKK